MNLPLHQILPGEPVPLYAQHVDDTGAILASCRIHGDVESSAAKRASSQFRIHSLYPLSRLRVSENGPPNVRSVHPYGSSNLLFLIVSKDGNRKGKNSADTATPTNASYRIALWDDKKEETLLELGFRDPVINLVSRRDKLVVVLEKRVVLFHLDFDNDNISEAIVREGEYETISNPLGLVSIATTVGSALLAFPGRQIGHVQVVRLPPLQAPSEIPRPAIKQDVHASANTAPPYPIVHIFLAHASALRTLTLSRTGTLLCTSSNKGTLLRVFSTANKTLIRELRRGTDQADIWSVAFLDPDVGEMVACASDKRTVHVWKVGDLSIATSSAMSGGQAASNNTPMISSLSGKGKETLKAFNVLKPYLPAYFSSQWSDLSWRIPHNASVTFQPSHVAALAEQDDVATCFFVRSQTGAHNIGKPQGRSRQNSIAMEHDNGANDPYYLLLITRSGAWYKLSVFRPVSTSSSTSTSKRESSHTQTYQNKQKTGSDRSSHSPASQKSRANAAERGDSEGNKCSLIEYKRIGYGTDGEEDAEEEYNVGMDSDEDDGNAE